MADAPPHGEVCFLSYLFSFLMMYIFHLLFYFFFNLKVFSPGDKYPKQGVLLQNLLHRVAQKKISMTVMNIGGGMNSAQKEFQRIFAFDF
jgi:hypothetical protein